MNNCLSSIALSLVNLGILACLIAFCVPYWVLRKDFTSDGNLDSISGLFNLGKAKHEGLWATCKKDMTCEWVWENDWNIEKKLEDWKKSSQGLYAGGVLLILISILISCLHICCFCCKEYYYIRSGLGTLNFAGVICIAASLGIYGGFMYNRGILDENTVFNWGYYLGVVGVISCFIASILFVFDGCNRGRREGYHMTRVI